MGEIIKVIMITAAGAEGISLKNTRLCPYHGTILASSAHRPSNWTSPKNM